MIRIRDSYRVPGKVRVTYGLLALNLLSFWVTHFSGNLDPATVLGNGGVVPAALVDALGPQSIDRPPAAISALWAMFLHVGPVHLIGNCIYLFLFGPNVEARLGSIRFLLFYLGCGAIGFFMQALLDLSSPIPIIGASGAISGLLGAYWIFFNDHYIRITIGKIGFNAKDIMLPVKVVLIIWVATQVFNGLLLPAPHGTDNTAYLTHIGGFLSGLILARTSGHRSKPSFKVFQGGKHDPWTHRS